MTGSQIGRIPAADIFFVLFAVTFFASRLVYYPRYLLWTVLYAGQPPPRRRCGAATNAPSSFATRWRCRGPPGGRARSCGT